MTSISFRRGRQRARQFAHGGSRHAAALRHQFRCVRAQRGLEFGQSGHVSGQAAEAHQLFVEQRVRDPEQEKDVGAGPDEMVLVGHRRRLGAARIDHHDLAAARAQRLGLAAEIGHRPQAAVRDHRIGAQDQQEVAALDVGHRHRQPAAEHQPDRQHLGNLVHAGGREHIAGAERFGQARKIQRQSHLVGGRVAQHRGHRIRAVGGDQRRQAALDFGVGFLPAGRDEHAGALDQRRAQAVRIVVQVFQADRLGTQETVREHVVGIGADAHHLVFLEVEFEAATGFAKWTNPVRAGSVQGHDGLFLGKSNGRSIVGIGGSTVNRNLACRCMLSGNYKLARAS
jgi:hypothetical protein